MRRAITLAMLAFLTGCTDFPDLDAVVSARARTADYPQILPLDALIASVPPVQSGLGVGNLPGRVGNLRARAAALSARPVVDVQTRRRMQAALRRHP